MVSFLHGRLANSFDERHRKLWNVDDQQEEAAFNLHVRGLTPSQFGFRNIGAWNRVIFGKRAYGKGLELYCSHIKYKMYLKQPTCKQKWESIVNVCLLCRYCECYRDRISLYVQVWVAQMSSRIRIISFYLQVLNL